MRYGIFSDIHGNLEALGAVSQSIKDDRIDIIICLGDIVGYGANPIECIELIKKIKPIIIMGNHDSCCADILGIDKFNAYARLALDWTKKILRKEDREYLASLPLIHDEGDLFTAVHGTLDDPEDFHYMLSSYDARESFRLMSRDVLFLGHTHVPGIFEMDDKKHVVYSQKTVIDISPSKKYIINTGSVGQPRDRDNRAAYVVYDTVKKNIEIKRVFYDFNITEEKILRQKLPEFLAYRLGAGE